MKLDPVTPILESIEQWSRMLGPAFLSLALFHGILGTFIYFMYTFNIKNKVVSAFPSQFQINFYFGSMIVTTLLLVGIVIFQSIAFHGYNKKPDKAA